MPSRLERLHALEMRYNGPIPISERDNILYSTPPARRLALNRVRTHRRSTLQAIEASTRWRAVAARGGYDHKNALVILRNRTIFICSLVQATSQLIAWQTHAQLLEKMDLRNKRDPAIYGNLLP